MSWERVKLLHHVLIMMNVYFQVNLGNMATAAMEKTEGSSYMVGSSSRMLCELENVIERGP